MWICFLDWCDKACAIKFFVAAGISASKKANAAVSGTRYQRCSLNSSITAVEISRSCLAKRWIDFNIRRSSFGASAARGVLDYNLTYICTRNTQISRQDLSSLGERGYTFRKWNIFRIYGVSSKHLAWCIAPGTRKETPRGAYSPRKITTSSGNSR